MAGTLLPLVLLSAFLTVAGYQDAKRDAAERVLQTTRSTMATVDRELQNEIAGLAGLAVCYEQGHDGRGVAVGDGRAHAPSFWLCWV